MCNIISNYLTYFNVAVDFPAYVQFSSADYFMWTVASPGFAMTVCSVYFSRGTM